MLAPLVHALIMKVVHWVKEGGKPPLEAKSSEAEVPESEAGSYEKSRTERGDSLAAAEEGKMKQSSHTGIILFSN